MLRRALVKSTRSMRSPTKARVSHWNNLLSAATLVHIFEKTVPNHPSFAGSCRSWYSTNRRISSKVFVSKHNTMNVTESEILNFCAGHGIDDHFVRKTENHVILKECPFCTKPIKGKADNMYKIYIQKGGGAYFCHRCGASGSWYDFRMKLNGFEITDGHSSTRKPTGPPHHRGASSTGPPRSGGGDKDDYSQSSHHTEVLTPCLPTPEKRLNACYISNLLDHEEKNDALDYLLNVRGLEKNTLRKYGVGRAWYKFPCGAGNCYVDAECVTFPWIMSASDVAEQEGLRGAMYEYDEKANPFVTRRIKARALENKGWQRLDPAGGGWGLFGFHTVPEDATEIVITEGEYDAMAVYQATGRPAVSLPNGCRSLPVEVLPMLERFEKVYLWMDNDAPGVEGAEKFANKMGLKRCMIVKSLSAGNPKDANEALLMGLDLNEFLDDAASLKHEFVLGFKDLREQVYAELLYPSQFAGVMATSLPQFSHIIKGFRRGEMTVLTGPTGSGKTTFLGQISLDFAEQGINTLWGSFEIKNTRLMHKLLQQYNRGPLPIVNQGDTSKLDALADRFGALPLHFLKFHGGSDVDDVLDAMDYAVYVHDVEHIILDNMQFMISRKNAPRSFDKFDIQDMAIEKFRSFATDKNVHITLVVHPRKEEEGVKLGISSVYGGAKATQEADTVVILQNDGRRKYIDVKKNRFDGTLGFSPLHFEKASGRYLETKLTAADATPPYTKGHPNEQSPPAEDPIAWMFEK